MVVLQYSVVHVTKMLAVAKMKLPIQIPNRFSIDRASPTCLNSAIQVDIGLHAADIDWSILLFFQIWL